ncbi:enoyl-CoA hydratase/isomerase family protein [Mesobacterium sp. TK19101]|uniref:Enoyl-CoA hydratase/isomerase family protein n=1 Tax=Mesobacterium hydrothermale TaxID=3111907 RepID=A0ABU6HEI4_9RHOB|nr:enoyl-CoA hydratase/isomerase family protein [Mesobacterium sp. TK19101]MEC3860879.1 enoyl-CoA hydratase/isomerase family protein [Mesobacterium sp. TK19101]
MIGVTEDGALSVITLNRPDKANALTEEMLEALCVAVEDSRDQKVLVLTGTGKVFCAGADLDAARAGLATSPLWERLSGAIARFGGLSIAALNGTCAGGAMGMALACDLRVCVPGTKFFYPVMKLGFLPQPSDPKRLAALVGPSRAKMILMAGQKIAADEALTWGLVNRIVEGDVVEEARALAADTLAADSAHVRGINGLF